MALAARRPLLSRGSRAPGGRLRRPDALPARPRPDRALQGVPAAQAQDAGVRGAGGRPLPDAAHPHAGDDADLAHGRAGTGAERGSDRGDRAGARPRSPAVRPHRGGRAGPLCARALRARLPTQRALAAGGRRAGAAEPDRAGAGRDPAALVRAPASRRRSRARSCGWSTGSPTSTTTSTTRCGQASSCRPTCRRRRSPCWGRAARGGSTGSCTTWSSTPRRRGTSCRARRSAARCCACAASCSRTSTSGRSRGPSTRRSSASCAACSSGSASTPRSCLRVRTARTRPTA